MTITHFLAGLTLLFYILHVFRLFPLKPLPNINFLSSPKTARTFFMAGLITHALFLYFVIRDAVSFSENSTEAEPNFTIESSPSLFLLCSSLVFFFAVAILNRGKTAGNGHSVIHRFSMLLGLALFLIGGLGIHSKEYYVEYSVDPLLITHILFSILGQVLVYFVAIISILIWLSHYRLKRKQIKSLEGFPAMSTLEKMFVWLLRLCTAFLFLSLLTGAFQIYSSEIFTQRSPLGLKVMFAGIFFLISCLSLLSIQFNRISITKCAKTISIIFSLLLLFQITIRANVGNYLVLNTHDTPPLFSVVEDV